ncbi:MAG: ribosomal-processing cysteine protease Prp [Clostridiales bacterium]|nr:ribosomal-processing cysteine protease Prp [Clostridiales bacterium]
MTNITVYRFSDGSLAGLMAKGHSQDSGLEGNDLVCCAVSVLMETGANALEEIVGLNTDDICQMDDGYLQYIIPADLDQERKQKAEIVLRTIEQGLKDIQKIYPKFIRIQPKEWRKKDAYDESSALRA